MAKVTITTSQLHFEDLEPHRFEDLIRQLIYDFRNWGKLESTGRSGSDDGYDARGWEKAESSASTNEKNDDAEEVVDFPNSAERLWLIQCKREKSITPAKLKRYLEEINPNELKNLHGIIFAAACDFSKKARDNFREFCHTKGISEFYLWSKSEIEDMLFQPKNDHLLFAYFGISLQIKQRTVKSKLSHILAIKRKIHSSIELGTEVLIRDAEDTRYPFLENTEGHRFERGKWLILKLKDLFHDGARFLICRHYAYIGDNQGEWDYDENNNQITYNVNDIPWYKRRNSFYASGENGQIWHDLKEHNKAWYKLYVTLPYENILAIDKLGDPFYDSPHIYTTQWIPNLDGKLQPPFTSYTTYDLSGINSFSGTSDANEDKRIEIFKRQ